MRLIGRRGADIIVELRAIDEFVHVGRKKMHIGLVGRPVVTEPRVLVHHMAKRHQHILIVEINTYLAAKAPQVDQVAVVRRTESEFRFIRRGEDDLVEQGLWRNVRVAEPAINGPAKHVIAHTVTQQIHPPVADASPQLI